MTAELERTEVDLGGLMRVLGEALYSTPDVAVRELVQNAHDSTARRRLEQSNAPPPRIRVLSDVGLRRLMIEDNGAGLTDTEIRDYLATVGRGYTRALRDDDDGGQLIGYFGLGFLSAISVSARTEVWTCSYQTPAHAWRFTSRNGETYSLEPAPEREIGTLVTLELREDFEHLADPEILRSLLRYYCALLSVPIEAHGELVNPEPPPWRSGAELSSLRRRNLSLEFARRFEGTFEPITTLEVNDAPEDGSSPVVRGLVWIQDGGSYATSDHRNVSVFVRGMFISRYERELLPAWAGFVGAVLESDALQPTASREALQHNSVFERVRQVVTETLITGLSSLAIREPANWRRVLRRQNEALVGAALSEPRLFELLSRELTLPTSEGDLTVPAILERSGGRLHVSQSDGRGFEGLLFRALRVPVVDGTRYGALPFAGRYCDAIEGELALLGTESGDGHLLPEASVEPVARQRLMSLFEAEDREVILSAFEPAHLPFMVIRDRDMELKRRIEADEADQRIGTAALGLARSFTSTLDERPATRFHVNMECPFMGALAEAPAERADLALRLLAPVSDMLAEGDARQDMQTVLQGFCDAIGTVLKEP